MKLRLVAAVLSIVYLAACGSIPHTASSAVSESVQASANALNPPVKIAVGSGPVIGAAPLFVALDGGYFKEQGLDVTATTPAATVIAQSVATNQMQFGVLGPDPATFNGMERGIDTKLVASVAIVAPNDKPAAIMIRKDLIDSGAYASPKDLKGRTVAIQTSVMTQLDVERFLNTDGLTTADVKVVSLAPPDQMSAFQNKGIDAAFQVEPLVTAAEKQNLAHAVAYVGQVLPGQIPLALIMNPSFGSSSPEAAKRFVEAFVHGLRDYYHGMIVGDREKATVVQALINHTAVKDSNLYNVIGLNSVDPNATMDATSWNLFQDYYIKIGVQKTKIDLTKYVDTSLTEAAVAKLGREPFTPPPCC